ncbi:MAG: glycosyltransferase [Acetivibrionales bacterium]
MNDKVCIIVIGHYPNSRSYKTMIKYVNMSYAVIVYNNGGVLKENIPSEYLENIIIIGDGINHGIGKAVNESMLYAYKKGFKYAIILDQDSYIDNNSLTALYEEIKDRKNIIICPLIYTKNSANNGSMYIVKKSRFKFKKELVLPNEIKEVSIVITSGMFVPIREFLEVGGYDEELFIEGVDDEFCLKLNKFNKKIIVNGNAILYQQYGDLTKNMFLGITFYCTNHKPIRRYYIFRNKIIISKKYGFQYGYYIVFQFFSLLKMMLGILLFEKNKFNNFIMICKGIRDGIFYTSKHT